VTNRPSCDLFVFKLFFPAFPSPFAVTTTPFCRLDCCLRVSDRCLNVTWRGAHRQHVNRFSCLNFRLVWIGSDDNPPERWPLAEKDITPVRSLKSGVMYERQGTGIVRREQLANGHIKLIPVTTFSARIVRDIILDDDAEHRREFGLEAEVGDKRSPALYQRQSSAEWAGCCGSWVHRRSSIRGSNSMLVPRSNVCRAQFSRNASSLTWAGGSTTGTGSTFTQEARWERRDLAATLRVELPAALQHYQVHGPPDVQEQGRAVRASLRCLSVAPDWISFPLLTSVYQAALGNVNFSLFLAGQTGVFKTALAALCQQHFGTAMDDRGLPTNFASIGNALQELAFHAKDALLVVDDFAPTGRHGDVDVSSGGGRHRCGDATVSPSGAMLVAEERGFIDGASVR
jgi:hypothetical protein